MATFVQDFSASQSGDGLTITLTDLSNWTDAGFDPSQFVRQFVITDSDGNVINTYQLPTNSNTLNYPIAVNQWQVITYNITGAFSATKVEKYPFEQIYRLAYVKKIAPGCGCCDERRTNLCSVDDFYQEAQFAIPIGDGISYDSSITSAYLLVTA